MKFSIKDFFSKYGTRSVFSLSGARLSSHFLSCSSNSMWNVVCHLPQCCKAPHFICPLVSHNFHQRPYPGPSKLLPLLPSFSRRSQQIFIKDGCYENYVQYGYMLSTLNIVNVCLLL